MIVHMVGISIANSLLAALPFITVSESSKALNSLADKGFGLI